MLVAKNEQISVAAEFTGDVGETPYECIGPNGNDVGRLSKRENRVSVTIEDLDPTVPHYVRFQFYVGKKTKRGKPTHQFDLAIVPEWFYIATEGVSLDVDVEDETLLSPGDSSLELTPPGRLDHDYEQTDVDITEDDQTVPFHGPLTIHPNPPDAVERISCLIAPPEAVPIRVTFLTEATSAETEEVIFPLMLSAIANPDRWAQEKLRLPDVLTIDTTRGGIYNASEESAGLEDDALELLQIEEHIITEQTPAGRIVDSDSLDYGTVADDTSELPAPLAEAYTALFEHFEQRNTTPSTDQWDEETVKRIQQVLEAYEQTVEGIDSPMTFGPYEPLRDLGTIQSTTTDKVWLTPFHPILLAYGLRIAQWRDEELVGSATAGFRREEFVKKFNPAGLLPYRTIDGSDLLLRGMPYRENPLWQVYSPVEAPGAVTPTYMERVIRDKLYTFVQAFPILFSLHPERPLTINLVNMGDLRPVVKGLYKFYKKIEKSEFEPPTILLRIYGGDGEGEALERFFTESAESRLRIQLEKKDDELVDVLRTKVRYIHAKEYVEENQKPAHLTFFRGLLKERPGIMTESGELPSGTLNEGLFPRESIDVDTTASGTVYTVGFSCDDDETEMIHRVARVVNALEAGANLNSYRYGQAPKKNVEATQGTNLGKLWNDSLWAVHVQPNVGIEFYLRSDTDVQRESGTLMIHYSDQYDSSSPNYDVITSTNKREPYLLSLRQALSEANLSQQLDPEVVLSTLVSVDGELALKLQRAKDTELVEFVGFVGGLALSRALLERSAPDHVWIPISLNELAQHDRSYRSGDSGLFQFDSHGKASDDLCFVGVPKNPADSTLKLWLVETKGGNAHIKTGRDQIDGALENLKEWLLPSTTYA